MGIKNAEATMLSAVNPASVVIGHREYREKMGGSKGRGGKFEVKIVFLLKILRDMEKNPHSCAAHEVARLNRRVAWLERTLTNVVRSQIWFAVALLLGLLIGCLL